MTTPEGKAPIGPKDTISDATSVPLKWILAILCFGIITSATLVAGRLQAAEAVNQSQDLRLQRLEDARQATAASLERIERKLGTQ